MPKFKKCPRCDINYIPIDQEYCDICEAEMKGVVLFVEDEEEYEAELCPKCHINYLNEGEKVCESCIAELEIEKLKPSADEAFDWEKEEEEIEVDEEDIPIPEQISLEGLAEEEAWDDANIDDEEDKDSELSPEDDFEEIDLDGLDDLDDDEYDDDDDDKKGSADADEDF